MKNFIKFHLLVVLKKNTELSVTVEPERCWNFGADTDTDIRQGAIKLIPIISTVLDYNVWFSLLLLVSQNAISENTVLRR